MAKLLTFRVGSDDGIQVGLHLAERGVGGGVCVGPEVGRDEGLEVVGRRVGRADG